MCHKGLKQVLRPESTQYWWHNTRCSTPAVQLLYSQLECCLKFPFPFQTTLIVHLFFLRLLIHSKTREHCLPHDSSPSHFPNLPFYLLFSSGQWLVCLCLSCVAVIRHNSECGCVIVLTLLFSVHKAVCICVRVCSSCTQRFNRPLALCYLHIVIFVQKLIELAPRQHVKASLKE